MEMKFTDTFGPPKLLGSPRGCNHATLSADGQVAVVTANPVGKNGPCSMVEIWRHGALQRSWFTGMNYPPVATNADGSLVATGGHQNCQLKLWNTADGTQLTFPDPLANEWSDGMSVAMDEAAKQLVSISSRYVRIWDLTTRTLRHQLPRPGAAATSAAAFTPDGKLLATTGSGHEIWLIDPATGQRLAILDFQKSSQPYSLTFNHDGTKLAANLDIRAVMLWDLTGLQQSLQAYSLSW
jgi:WD40 repeat protein